MNEGFLIPVKPHLLIQYLKIDDKIIADISKWIKGLYIDIFCWLAQVAMFDKILYG